MAFGHDQTIQFLNKFTKIRNPKIFSKGTSAISAHWPPRFRQKYRHRLCRSPTIWSLCDRELKKHWKPDGLKQIIFQKTSKSTRTFGHFLQNLMKSIKIGLRPITKKSKFWQSTHTDHSVALRPKSQHLPKHIGKQH